MIFFNLFVINSHVTTLCYCILIFLKSQHKIPNKMQAFKIFTDKAFHRLLRGSETLAQEQTLRYAL
jgi:hypothetical protein